MTRKTPLYLTKKFRRLNLSKYIKNPFIYLKKSKVKSPLVFKNIRPLISTKGQEADYRLLFNESDSKRYSKYLAPNVYRYKIFSMLKYFESYHKDHYLKLFKRYPSLFSLIVFNKRLQGFINKLINDRCLPFLKEQDKEQLFVLLKDYGTFCLSINMSYFKNNFRLFDFVDFIYIYELLYKKQLNYDKVLRRLNDLLFYSTKEVDVLIEIENDIDKKTVLSAFQLGLSKLIKIITFMQNTINSEDPSFRYRKKVKTKDIIKQRIYMYHNFFKHNPNFMRTLLRKDIDNPIYHNKKP